MPKEVRDTKLSFYYFCRMDCNVNEFENIRLQNQIKDTISDNVIAYEMRFYLSRIFLVKKLLVLIGYQITVGRDIKVNAVTSNKLNYTLELCIEFFRNVPEKLRNGTKYECI